MKEKTKDIQKFHEALQKTLDFHMMEVQGLFPRYKVTLIVRDPIFNEPIFIYSDDDKAEEAMKDALKKLEDKKKKKKEPL